MFAGVKSSAASWFPGVLWNRPGLWRHCGDGKQRRSLDSPEFPQGLLVLVETPLRAAPLPDDVEVDGLDAGDTGRFARKDVHAVAGGVLLTCLATEVSTADVCRDLTDYRKSCIM